MQFKTFSDVDEKYELEIERIVKTILKEKAKKILLQFPEGMKPYATAICDEITKRIGNKCECFIWLDSCFGACDVPVEVSRLGVDLIVQFGHSNWSYSKEKGIKVVK